MAKSSQVLVLVADEQRATLCTNHGGETRLLRQIARATANNDADADADASRLTQNVFACELMMALERCIGEQDCEGVIIFAEASMMEKLRLVQTKSVARRLMAQIVGKPAEPCRFPGISAANAQAAYCGARP